MTRSDRPVPSSTVASVSKSFLCGVGGITIEAGGLSFAVTTRLCTSLHHLLMTYRVGLDGGDSSTSLLGTVFFLTDLRKNTGVTLLVVVEVLIMTLLAVGIIIDVVGVK